VILGSADAFAVYPQTNPPPTHLDPTPPALPRCIPFETTPPTEPLIALCKQGIILDVMLGGGSTSLVKENGDAGVVSVGASVFYYYGWFEVGAGYTVQGSFGPSTVVYGALVGVNAEPEPTVRFDLLAEVGADVVSGFGQDLLQSAVTSDTVTLPYVGGRGSFSVRLGEARRWLFGIWLAGGATTSQSTIHPVVDNCAPMGACPQQLTFTAGGSTWSLGLHLGGKIAVW
jgi:hypothetical protein